MVQRKLLMTTEQIEILAGLKKIDSIYGIRNVKREIEKADGKYYKNNCIYSEIISMLTKEWLVYERKDGKQYIGMSKSISEIFENIKNASSVIIINSFLKRKSSICCYINGSNIVLMESFEGDKKIRIFKTNKEDFLIYLCERGYIIKPLRTEDIKNNININTLAKHLPQQKISDITFLKNEESVALYEIIFKNGKRFLADKLSEKEEEYSFHRMKKIIREKSGWRYRNDK